jgi:hypothetical protein
MALVLARHTFERLGGFCNLPIMEDFDFVRRLRRIGQIAISPLPVRTSARRWQELGPLRTTCINQMMILGYYLGLPCTRLANLVSSPKSDLSRERRSAAR